MDVPVAGLPGRRLASMLPLGAPTVQPIKIKKALKSAAGRAAEAVGVMRRQSGRSMTIVAFHRVNDQMPEDGLTCSTDKFIAFCDFFRRHFRVISLSAQVEGRRRGLDMRGTLSVTFDDGYQDNFTVAVPILEKFGIPATFFLTTGFVGTSRIAPWDHGLKVPQKWMDWEQARQLVSRGFDIGSHTDRHLNLSTSDISAVQVDLQASKRRLEQELGVPIKLFAYPFGGRRDISEASRDLVREMGFECCVSCFGGVNPADRDPHYFQRIAIGEWFASPHQFALEFVLGRI